MKTKLILFGIMLFPACLAAMPQSALAVETKLTLPGTNYYDITNNTEYDDGFGGAVGISGDYAIVSAYDWDPDEIANDEDIDDMDWGTAWIFKRDQSGVWSMVTRLTESNPRYDPYGRNDRLGTSAAIDGDVCVICSGETALTQNWSAEYGACALFHKDQGGTDNWGVKKWVQGTTNTEGEHYGYAVALDSDYLVVGERNYGTDWNGAAFLYQRDYGGADNWGMIKSLSSFPDYAAFGVSAAVDGSASPVRVIIGADYNQNGHAGSAYIYEQGGAVTSWSLAATKDGDVNGDQFGHAVAIQGDWAFVGAHYNDAGGNNRGKVYIYKRNVAGAWSLDDTLTAPDAADNDYFGSALAVDGDALLVGARGDDPGGSVYVYTFGDESWSYARKLAAKGIEAGDNFGYNFNSVTSLDVYSNTVIVGAPGYDTTHSDEGAAFIFDLNDLGVILSPVHSLLLRQ